MSHLWELHSITSIFNRTIGGAPGPGCVASSPPGGSSAPSLWFPTSSCLRANFNQTDVILTQFQL